MWLVWIPLGKGRLWKNDCFQPYPSVINCDGSWLASETGFLFSQHLGRDGWSEATMLAPDLNGGGKGTWYCVTFSQAAKQAQAGVGSYPSELPFYSHQAEGLLFCLGKWWWTLAPCSSSGVDALQIPKTEMSSFPLALHGLSLLWWHLLLQLSSLRLLAWPRGAGAEVQGPALLGT